MKPGRHLYEYAVIRVVPRVEREEFVNAGVILYCPTLRFLQADICLHAARVLALCPEADIAAVSKALDSLQHIAAGGRDCGPIGLLDVPGRFRWLTAWRSTVVQTSRVHSGLCEDAALELARLSHLLVA